MIVYTAPQTGYLRHLADDDYDYVFLAGSIEEGKARRWQDLVIQSLNDESNTIVLNPRRDNWSALDDYNLDIQIGWELNAIRFSDIVFFYFDPDTKSPVSLLELGLCIGSGKQVIVCCPDGFYRKQNVKITCNNAGFSVYNDLDSAVNVLKQILRERNSERNT